MNSKFIIKYQNIILRPLIEDDINFLRLLRNDHNLSKYLTKIDDISMEQQISWFKSIKNDNNSVFFAIDEQTNRKGLVGSCAIYDINENNAEFGKIIVDPIMKGQKIGYNSMFASLFFGFEFLGIKCFIGKVFDDNIAAKINDLKVGFKIVGEKYVDNIKELQLGLTKDDFYILHSNEIESIVVEKYE